MRMSKVRLTTLAVVLTVLTALTWQPSGAFAAAPTPIVTPPASTVAPSSTVAPAASTTPAPAPATTSTSTPTPTPATTPIAATTQAPASTPVAPQQQIQQPQQTQLPTVPVGPATRQADLAQFGNGPQFLGNVQANRVFECWGGIIAGSVLADTLTTRANLNVEGLLTANIVKAKSVDAQRVNIAELYSPTGTITVNGNLALINDPSSTSTTGKPFTTGLQATAFIAEDVVIGGVKQWRLVRHDDFENGAQGWSLLETSSCRGRDQFLGGHCKIAAGSVKKMFDNLPAHDQVRVTARYHMIDDWQGETAFLKLGEHIVWSEHTTPLSDKARSVGLDMCGNSLHPERKFSIPIDVTLPHSDSLLEVAFGSTGDALQNPCDRSFGVDDVMVYVR